MVIPPKICPAGTCEYELIWKKVFAEVTKLGMLSWDSSWIKMVPKSNGTCPFKRRRKDTTKLGEVMLPQAKECWTPQKLEEARKDSSLETLEEVWPRRHLDFGILACRTV